ncbi:methionyl-tRNA formyltransferase [Neomegalonema sp.]|uniref:methionyl-tRNA formyltransferase n=1 Tax=Neomegalonema sp. TaxID=2039713 RepID=UPI002605241A|nr:methionyl-tRNA formyltransferase [Neomegalonema sp.]MDD2867988.1 methionyl-tRNA formyltransferase [Neomegalonema sp.]
MRLIFMGSPGFALPALDALAAAGHEILAVYCRAPKPAGRGGALRPTPVEVRARELGLTVETPRTLRDPEAQARFAGHGAQVAVVAAYGLILPIPVLEAPEFGCLNIHPSLLPRWRGAAPLQRAVMAGDPVTGVCVMRMSEGLDEGPVLKRVETPLSPLETSGDLHDRLARLGAELMLEALADLEAGRAAEAVPQPEEGVVYAAKILKEEARISWDRAPEAVLAHLHGLSPAPGAWTELAGERVKILRARLEDSPEPEAAPGMLLDDRLLISCAAGSQKALRALILQRPGKSPMAAEDLLRGFPLSAGTALG